MVTTPPSLSGQSPSRPWLSTLLWWVLFLSTACTSFWVLNQDFKQDPHFPFLLYPLLPLLVASFTKASRNCFRLSRPFRIAHWMSVLILGAVFFTFINAQWVPMLKSVREGNPFFLALAATVLVSIFLWLRRDKATPFFASLSIRSLAGDAAISLAVCLVSFATIVVLLNVRAGRREHEAEQLWNALGRPMNEFGKKFVRTAENDGMRVLATDLSAFNASAYGRESYTQDHLNFPDDLTSRTLLPSDTIPDSQSITRFLGEQRAVLDHLYDDVLTHEPPIWMIEPDKWPQTRVPNFLILRKMSQMMNADALEALRTGDSEKAHRILAAGLRLSEGLGKNYLLISQMIRTAIECNFVNTYARIPDDSLESWETLTQRPADVAREGLRISLQAEAYSCARLLASTDKNQLTEITRGQVNYLLQCAGTPIIRISSKPLAHLPFCVIRPLVRFDVANNSIATAKLVELTLNPKNLSDGDFGFDQIDKLCVQYPSVMFPNYSRAWARLNACLLLREQATLIHRLRKEITKPSAPLTGQIVSEIFPGNQWVYTLDPTKGSVKLLFQKPPEALSFVTTKEFYLVPIDGSGEWKFGGS